MTAFLVIVVFIVISVVAYVIAALVDSLEAQHEHEAQWQAEVTRQLVLLKGVTRVEQAAAATYRQIEAVARQAGQRQP